MEGQVSSEGDVSIGQDGAFDGDIRARRVVVCGRFKGNIDCERLEIVACGHVEGEIEISELVIEAGGQFSGASRIKNQTPRQIGYQGRDTEGE